MKIAVTGGSGKLGRTVVAVLRQAGHDVVNLDVAGLRNPGFVRVDHRRRRHGDVAVQLRAGGRDLPGRASRP